MVLGKILALSSCLCTVAAQTTVPWDVSTIAGNLALGSGPPNNGGYADGVGTAAAFFDPNSVAVDGAGTFAIVADSLNHLLRRVNLASSLVTTIAGNVAGAGSGNNYGHADGQGDLALFYSPYGVSVNDAGTFAIVADSLNHAVRRVNLTSGLVTTLAGDPAQPPGYADGTGPAALFHTPYGVCIDDTETFALISDNLNHLLRRVELASGSVTTIAGDVSSGVGPSFFGFADGAVTAASLAFPAGVAARGTFALIADSFNNAVRRVDLSSGVVTTLAGNYAPSPPGNYGHSNGAGSTASFKNPTGVAIDATGTFAIVTDNGNHLLRFVNLTSGLVTTVAGGTSGVSVFNFGSADGSGTLARFRFPISVAVDRVGSFAVVADVKNHLLRRVAVRSYISSSASFSALPSASPSITITQTASPSITQAQTFAQSESVTQAQSPPPITITQTASPSITQAQTFAQSESATQAQTAAPSVSQMQTFSATVTPSDTQDLTISQTATSTSTPSITETQSSSSTATPSCTQSRTVTASGTTTSTPSQTQSLSPSSSATPSCTQSRSGTASRTAISTPSLTQTQSPSATATPSSSQSPSATASETSTSTASLTQTNSPSGSLTPSCSLSPTETTSSTPSQSQTQSSSVSATPSSSQTPSQTSSRTSSSTPSVTRTQSPSSSATPSATATASPSPRPFLMSLSEAATFEVSPNSIVVSDGRFARNLRISLNRCPSASEMRTLSVAQVSCHALVDTSPVFVALGSHLATDALFSAATSVATGPATLASPCDSTTNNGQTTALALSVFVGALFRAPHSSIILECSIRVANSLGAVSNTNVALAATRQPLRVLPTRWPLWDDAILVSATGLMRSARLGIVINASAALLKAAESVRHNIDPPLADHAPGDMLVTALAVPRMLLDVARNIWDGPFMSLNYTERLGDATKRAEAFSLVLSGASRLVLFAGLTSREGPFAAPFAADGATTATLGDAACNVSSVSDDRAWAVVDTPGAAEVCGDASAATGECGYVTLSLTSAPSSSGDVLGATLACPPFCPGVLSGGAIPLATRSGEFALGANPPSTVGTLPSFLPSLSYGISSEGIYYAAACAQTGLFTDPTTGACSNASDPTSYACAYGSGDACRACPSGALCPGGSRLWPRSGFWAPNEASTSVTPCGPPDPGVKCGGWNVSRGAVQCGRAYQSGSPSCGACAPDYYLPGDGSCVPCPTIASAWDRFRGLIALLGGVLTAALCVGLLLIALVRFQGGSVDGCARLLLDLVIWSVAVLQTVSQAAPASAAALPPFMSSVFRGLSVLQLDGVLLPPACTGDYAFESQVGVMSAALALAIICLVSLLLYVCSRPHGVFQATGGVASRAALLLTPPAARDALALLNCMSVVVSPAGCTSLNGCVFSGSSTRSSKVDVRVLASNPFYVCWAPSASHFPAGVVAVIAVAVVVLAYPLASFAVLWRRARFMATGRQIGNQTSHPNQTRDVYSATPMVVNPLHKLHVASAVSHAATVAVPLNACVPPPVLAPFVSDYRPEAWYTRHADLALTLFLAALQAFIPTPVTEAELVGKAAVIIVSTLAVALHTLWVRPFIPAHAWKAPVRAALLMLAAASAAVIAWAGALDLRLIEGTLAVTVLTAGAYVLVVLFAVVIAALVFGVAGAMSRSIRDGNLRMRVTVHSLVAPQAKRVTRSLGLHNDLDLEAAMPPPSIAFAGRPDAGGITPSDPMVDFAFAVHPVRCNAGTDGSQRRRRQDGRVAAVFAGYPGMKAAAAALMQPPRVNYTPAQICAACEEVVTSLDRLSVAEAGLASAALLPGLSARLNAALSENDDRVDAEIVASVCRAMAALSDHTDEITLSRLGRGELPLQLVRLLRLAMLPSVQPDGETADRRPLLLATASHALWLIGNIAADQGAAVSFSAAGGATLLINIIASAPFTYDQETVLQACVAVASISAHADAALPFLDAGAFTPLARLLQRTHTAAGVREALSLRSASKYLNSLPTPVDPVGSLADAEAACSALRSILHYCAAVFSSRPVVAMLACRQLVASDVVEGCTSLLQWHLGTSSCAHEGGGESSTTPLATDAAEVLLSVIGCIRLVESSVDHEQVRVVTAALIAQFAAADTERIVRALTELRSPFHSGEVAGLGTQVVTEAGSELESVLLDLSSELQSLMASA